MTDITLRRLQSGDEAAAGRIAHLFKESVIEASHAATFLANPANYLIVAEIGGTLVGFLLAYRLDRIDRRAGQLFIYEIDVDPDSRRRGVGSALMRYAVGVVDREAMMEAFLITNSSNAPAMALFHRAGGTAVDDDGVVFAYPGPTESPVAPL